ncbi:GGDEF domain-containing protein [Mycolicibacterium frederiksbergense]|uniref:GGDEF domain-containing protein n=1 Tax=Mycolicibacterium frederiksbergense TaxID=117567 RepID=UPI00265BC057|nr:GGDEF domain-containing protein [Mycolicibacterium frederiksbergense]MDO0977065.1 GGDEF domain-containing protein [Mycolicibacterium frederiksbergense]
MSEYSAALRSWWRQPDHYDWLSGYLDAQRLRGLTRSMMVAVIVLLGTAPVLMHWSPGGPADGLPTLLSVMLSLVTAAMAVLWARRWPTREQSRAFAVTATLCIAAACLLDRDPVAGLLGCACFAAMAGYVAFFHTSRHLVAVIGVALATTGITAIRFALAGDPAGAASKFLVILVGVLAVPGSIQVLVRLLGSDAAESDVDSLTNILNRRGFDRAAYELVARAGQYGGTVGVILVDLDGFKRINDTRGHAAGDRLLITVTEILREHTAGDDIVAARFGGEEFLVCGRLDDTATAALAERIRLDVAALPDAVTVSIGSALATIGDITDQEIMPLVNRLVEAADDAMYRAKRAGGNRVQRNDHEFGAL